MIFSERTINRTYRAIRVLSLLLGEVIEGLGDAAVVTLQLGPWSAGAGHTRDEPLGHGVETRLLKDLLLEVIDLLVGEVRRSFQLAASGALDSDIVSGLAVQNHFKVRKILFWEGDVSIDMLAFMI